MPELDDWKEVYMALQERVAKTEWRQDQTDGRLREGAQTFGDVKESIEKLHERVTPKPLAPIKLVAFILGPILGLAIIIASVIWQAARYPDPQEFQRLQQDVQQLRIDQARQSEVLRRLDAKLTNADGRDRNSFP